MVLFLPLHRMKNRWILLGSNYRERVYKWKEPSCPGHTVVWQGSSRFWEGSRVACNEGLHVVVVPLLMSVTSENCIPFVAYLCCSQRILWASSHYHQQSCYVQDYHQMDEAFKVPRCLHSPRKVTLRSTTPEPSRMDYNCCKCGEAQAGGAYSKGNVKSKEHSLVIHLICHSRHVFCSSIKDRWTTHRFQELTVISPKFPILPFSLRNVAENSSPFPLGWKSVSGGSLLQHSYLLLSRSLGTCNKFLYLFNVDLFHLIHCQFLQRNWR